MQDRDAPIPEAQRTAGASGGLSDDGRPETHLQRLDRNLEEMTGELRVVVTGVQVLFAFLLIVPFNQGFSGVGPFERTVYFVTLLCSAFAALFTIAPAAYHRMLFRSDEKRQVVFFANHLVIAGLVFLALAMCGSLLLVTTKLFGASAGAITAALVAVAFVALWFVAPLYRRAVRKTSDPSVLARAERLGPVPAGELGTPGDRAHTPAGIGLEHQGQVTLPRKAVRYDLGVGAQEHLRVETRREQDRVVLHLTGELDLASSPIFERALEASDITTAPSVVLDLDELKFVDSTGLRIILLAHEAARARGQQFAITRGSSQVQRLLSITSVAEHMRVIASPDDLLV